MPVIVNHDLPAGDVRTGHYVFGEKVIQTNHKRVNTTIVLENPVSGRTEWPFKLSDMLEVGVPEPTAEELAEKERENREFEREYLVKKIDKLTAGTASLVEEAIAQIKPDWVRHHDIDGVIYAEAHRRIYGTFAHLMERAREQKLHKAHVDGGDCEYTESTENGNGRRCVKPTVPTTAWDGAEECVRWIAGQLATSAMQFRASSRSTSVMSNYMEDVYLETLGKVARDLRYAVGSELRDVLPDAW